MSKTYEIEREINNMIDAKATELMETHATKISATIEADLKKKGILSDYMKLLSLEKAKNETDNQIETIKNKLRKVDKVFDHYNWETDLQNKTAKKLPEMRKLYGLKDGLRLRILLNSSSTKLTTLFDDIKSQLNKF